MSKFFVVPSWKAFEVFLPMGMIVTAVLVYGGTIANPVAIVFTAIGLTLLFVLLYRIGFHSQFQGWDPSWRKKVEDSRLLVLDCVRSGIFAVFGAIWAAIKAVINKGKGLGNPDH